VRISLGRPKWFTNEAIDVPFVKALTPAPGYFNEPDDTVFENKCRHQLHRWTAERVLADLRAIAVGHDCPHLVLCCFEADPMACHRSTFTPLVAGADRRGDPGPDGWVGDRAVVLPGLDGRTG